MLKTKRILCHGLLAPILFLCLGFVFPAPAHAQDPAPPLQAQTASAPAPLTDSLSLNALPLFGSFASLGESLVDFPDLELHYEHAVCGFASLDADAWYDYQRYTQGYETDGFSFSSVFELSFACRFYPGGRPLRHFYIGPGFALIDGFSDWDDSYDQAPSNQSDYGYGPSLETGYIWMPFDAWSIDLGFKYAYLLDTAGGHWGSYNNGKAEIYLLMGYAWNPWGAK